MSSNSPKAGKLKTKNKTASAFSHKKFILLLSAVFVIIVAGLMISIGSCSDKEDTVKTTPTSSETQPTTTMTTTKSVQTTTENLINPTNINPLTGQPLSEDQKPDSRPVALMINNIKVATPQIGISQADLLFEMEVEYGITRLLAVFSNVNDIPEIGSIRSSRHDYIDLAGALDAIYVHMGGSYKAYDQIYSQKTPNLDGQVLSSTFWRDQEWLRNRGYEHSVKTNGERLASIISEKQLRDTVNPDYAHPFLFNKPDQFEITGSIKAESVKIPFSSYVTSTLKYDQELQAFEKSQYGQEQLDLLTNKPISFTNVLILQTTVGRVGSDILAEIDLSGGDGYYLSGGMAEPVSWSKGDTFDKFVFKRADGSDLTLNSGKTYFAIVSKTRDITFD